MEQKTWLVERPGGDFRQAQLPRPKPGMNQVLVRISASGVNPLDTKIRAGKAAHARQPLPAVLGLDMAGTVEETGPGGVGHIAVQLARAFGAKVFATVSPEKKQVVENFGAIPIDYRAASVEEYVAAHTEGKGFDIVYDTVGGTSLDASFTAVKRYTGHVLSSLGWGSHSLASLSFRGATYSGVFTLHPLISGENRAHYGEILARAAALVEAGKLTPLLNERRFSTEDLEAAYVLVEAGALGKVIINL